jgi:hypothetical protein
VIRTTPSIMYLSLLIEINITTHVTLYGKLSHQVWQSNSLLY